MRLPRTPIRLIATLGALALWVLTTGLGVANGREANTAIVAQWGEPSFEERFNVELNLPMEEDAFLRLIERLDLTVSIQGTRRPSGGPTPVPSTPTRPFHTRDYDMSDIVRSYVIYGGYNKLLFRQEDYLALVRNDGMVVYVETRFAYTNMP